MKKQSKLAARQRGGVPLKDYTRSGMPSPLERLRSDSQKSGWNLINFDHLGRGMIFSSLGLGLAELLVPGRLLRLIGVRDQRHSGLVRLLGAREVFSALLLFSQARPFHGMWSRVAGDVIDLGLLAAAFSTRRPNKKRLAAATAAIAGITAVDALTTAQIGQMRAQARAASDFTRADLNARQGDGAFRVTRSITINRPADELYRYWRNFENLPNFMYHLESVEVLDERRSRWTAKAPAGQQVSWEAEITADEPDALIAWRSTEDADVQNSGEVRFEPLPNGRGTVVRVLIEYHMPAGALGKFVATLFGREPAQQAAGDLRRFKSVIETGDVLRSDGSQQGTGQIMQRPARPLTAEQPEERKDRKNKGASKWPRTGKRAESERIAAEESAD